MIYSELPILVQNWTLEIFGRTNNGQLTLGMEQLYTILLYISTKLSTSVEKNMESLSSHLLEIDQQTAASLIISFRHILLNLLIFALCNPMSIYVVYTFVSKSSRKVNETGKNHTPTTNGNKCGQSMFPNTSGRRRCPLPKTEVCEKMVSIVETGSLSMARRYPSVREQKRHNQGLCTSKFPKRCLKDVQSSFRAVSHYFKEHGLLISHDLQVSIS